MTPRSPGRHDRIPTGSHDLPEDRGERQAVALQMIHNTIVCAAPDGLRDQLRSLTRMQLVRTLASWLLGSGTAYRDLDSAYRIGLNIPCSPLPRTCMTRSRTWM